MTQEQFQKDCENLPVAATYIVGPTLSGMTRTTYAPLYGVVIVEEDDMPCNPFQKSRHWAGIDIAVSEEVATRIAEQYSGLVRECPYCQESDPRYYVRFKDFATATQFVYDRAFNGLWKEVGSCETETTESMS